MSILAASDVCQAVSARLCLPLNHAKYVLQQTDKGATVPFLARYRRDETGNMDESLIRRIIDVATEAKEVERRRQFMLRSLEERRLLTPALRDMLLKMTDLNQLEDVWEPYKVRKASLAARGREAGLDAAGLLDRSCPLPHLLQQIRRTKDGEKLLLAVIVEDVSRNSAVLGSVMEYVADTACLAVSVVKAPRKNVAKALHEDEFAKLQKMYANYDGRSWSSRRIRSHVLLAVQRGEDKGALQLSMSCGPAIHGIFRRVCEEQFAGVKDRLKGPQNDELRLLQNGLNAAREHLIATAHKSIRRDLKKRAEEEAIGVFATNLRHMLLQRPLTQARILAMDPGLTNGVKCVALDENGSLLITFKCSLLEEAAMIRKVRDVVEQTKVNKIVIGNGTASQRTAQVVSRIIKEAAWPHVEFAVVSEVGASVYSVSEAAQEEFPQLDALYRGAVSIGRRVLDPLSELVKIPVKSMGIGMYQHDVPEKNLVKALSETVESCVAAVGVNAAVANKYVMERVPAINKKLVQQIVLARHAKRLNNREDFRHVPSMTETIYTQTVGFFRFPNSPEPLDNTVLLPEWYEHVRRLEKLLAKVQESTPAPATDRTAMQRRLCSLGEHLGTLNDADFKKVAETVGCGVECLKLIAKELKNPGLDPRSTLPHAGFMRTRLLELSELSPGDVINGIVRSVTPFGAFVDCGLHQDVLVRELDVGSTHPGALLETIIIKGIDDLGRLQVMYQSTPTAKDGKDKATPSPDPKQRPARSKTSREESSEPRTSPPTQTRKKEQSTSAAPEDTETEFMSSNAASIRMISLLRLTA
eukprot:gene4845-3471_t